MAGNDWSPTGSISLTNLTNSSPQPVGGSYSWQFKRSSDQSFSSLTTNVSLTTNDELRVSFEATDSNGCSVDTSPAPSVKVDGTSTTTGITATATQQENTDTYDVVMTYTIQSSDGGAINDFSLSLTDGSSSGTINIPNPTSITVTADTDAPEIDTNSLEWTVKKGPDTGYVALNQNEALSTGLSLKLEFDVTDATGCSVSSSSVTVGSGTGNSSNTFTNVSGNTTDGFTVTMEYVIDNNDNGTISFDMTLTDGTNHTSLTTRSGNANIHSYRRHNRTNIQ